MIRRPPRSPLFPSPTLFRSRTEPASASRRAADEGRARPARRDAEPDDDPARAQLRRTAAVHGRREPRAKDADRKSTRLNSSHSQNSYAVFCLKKKKKTDTED